MAREYAKAWFSMFTDNDFVEQPHGDKWLYMVLIGQPALNYAGIQPMNLRRWARALRDGDGTVPADAEIEQRLNRMQERRFVFTDPDTGEVLVRTFMRSDQIARQPNVLKSALRALAHVESPKLAVILRDELGLIELPEVKSDKLAQDLRHLYRAAETHLEGLAEGFAEPFEEPFPRPAETEPFEEPFREGLREGSVVVGVEVESPPQVVTLGSTRAREKNPNGTPRPALVAVEPTETPSESEPPQRCAAHREWPAEQPVPPCGPCANFRKAHERWTARAEHTRAAARSEQARETAELARMAIDACTLCDHNGYRPDPDTGRPGAVCDHDPNTAERNARGIAQVRAALAAKGIE